MLQCDIIVLHIHAPTEDKIHDMKVSFYEESERVFDKSPKMPHDHFAMRFQYQSRKGRHFQTCNAN